MNIFIDTFRKAGFIVLATLWLQGCGSDGGTCCGGDAMLSEKLGETSTVKEVPETDANGNIVYVDRNVTVIEYVDRNVTVIQYVDRNVTQYVERNVTVDVIKVRPDAVIGGFSDGAVLRGDTLVINANASEDSDGAVVSYRWMLDDENISTKANPTMQLPTTEGTHTLCLVVKDNDNLESRTRCRTFTIPHVNQNPTAVMIGLDNNNTNIKTVCPLAVTAVNSIANDGSIQSYEWSIDDNQTLNGMDQNLSFVTVGAHKVCLKVRDSNGLEDKQCSQVEVFGHKAPTAMMRMKDSADTIITQEMNLTRGARYDFSCAGSHDDCGNETPLTCEWNAHSYRIGEDNKKIDYIRDCMSHNNAPRTGETSWVQLCTAPASSFEYIEVNLKITDQFGKTVNKIYVYGVNP